MSTTSRPRVLCADDKASVLDLVRKVLEANCDVTTASDGDQALELLAGSPFDVIVTDVRMPGADGLALCDMVRTDQALKELPVILLTGHDNAELRRRCKQAGAHYVRKDLDAWKNLQPLIRRLLSLAPSPELDPGKVGPDGSALNSENSAAQEAGARSTQQPQAPRQTKKVLIIDDDPEVAQFMQ